MRAQKVKFILCAHTPFNIAREKNIIKIAKKRGDYMLHVNNYSYENSYFAAANGYTGFRSYFDSIFNNEKLDMTFILKGGPGTGKSTLMKRILCHFEKSGYQRDAIFCSSDPESLDGVIISRGAARVAVIDGTAPHERDARLPGVCDVLVNLGEGFDLRELASRKSEATELSKKKKEAYSKAYKHLFAAACVAKDIDYNYSNYADYTEAEKQARSLVEDACDSHAKEIRRLLKSSFGCRGYQRITDKVNSEKRTVRISGDGVGEYILIRKIHDVLEERGTLSEVYISPFSDDIIEGVSTETTAWTVSRTGGDVDASAKGARSDNTLSSLFRIHDELLDMAADEFSRASKYHFALEKIYSSAIDFSFNDRVFCSLSAEIDGILEK